MKREERSFSSPVFLFADKDLSADSRIANLEFAAAGFATLNVVVLGGVSELQPRTKHLPALVSDFWSKKR